jgi:hypothetical protein
MEMVGLFDTNEGHLAQTLYNTYYLSELGINWRWQAIRPLLIFEGVGAEGPPQS